MQTAAAFQCAMWMYDIAFMPYGTVPNLLIIIAAGYWDNDRYSRLMGLPWHDIVTSLLVYTLHHPLCK